MSRALKEKVVGLILVLFPYYAVLADTASEYKSAQSYISSQNLSSEAFSAALSSTSMVPKSTVDSSQTSEVIKEVIAKQKPSSAIEELVAQIHQSKEIQKNAHFIVSKENIYCSDGLCQETDKEKNEGFGTSITDLSALAEAASDLKDKRSRSCTGPSVPDLIRGITEHCKDSHSIRIFTGRAIHCRDMMLGARNCCADSGWASGLVHCRAEENELGSAKERGGLVVYTGRYCSHHAFGFCTEHKKGYCIFPSRIAYDIQIGGRQAQIGRGFGGARNPDCSGLTPDEMTRIHLEKIDFSNAVNDATSKKIIPSNSEILSKLLPTVRQRAKVGYANG